VTNFKPGDRVRFVDKEYVTSRFTIGEILTIEEVSDNYLYFEGKDDTCLRSERVELVNNETPKIGDEVEITVRGRVTSMNSSYYFLDDNVIGVKRSHEVKITKSAPVFPEEPGTLIRSKSSGVFEYARVANRWVEVNGGEILAITPTFADFEVVFTKENEND